MTGPLSRRLATVVALPLMIVLAGCGDDAESAAGATAAVTVETFAFGPDPLEIAAGTTITFTNRDAIDHTVTAGTREDPTPDVFDGQLPEAGATFELTLEEPGTYPYFCEIHPGPGMTATLVVR